MPIKPENRKLYPAGPVWRKIRSEILSRANHRCECAGECGLNHGLRCEAFDRALGYWVDGDWHLTIEGEDVDASLVVLTIAHLDHDPTNNAETNLRALCQRCHLRYDLDLHKRNAARTRREKAEAESGQVVMFEKDVMR